MKKCLIIIFTAVMIQVKAQEQQLIIRVPQLSETNVKRISRQLACIDGVHFSGYAKDASCLLLRFDNTFLKDPVIITSMIHHLNKKLKVEIIDGYTAFEVIDGKLPAQKNSNAGKTK